MRSKRIRERERERWRVAGPGGTGPAHRLRRPAYRSPVTLPLPLPDSFTVLFSGAVPSSMGRA
jgi:hypothetical protein